MHLSSVELSNGRNTSIRLWLEPWAESIEMDPGRSLVLECEAQIEERVLLELHDDKLIAYGPRTSYLKVFEQTELIWECYERLK